EVLAKSARNQKRQDVRLRRGEVRSACPVARARASTKYERTVSAFDRVRITPLHYSNAIRSSYEKDNLFALHRCCPCRCGGRGFRPRRSCFGGTGQRDQSKGAIERRVGGG